jgi:competence protein ComEA
MLHGLTIGLASPAGPSVLHATPVRLKLDPNLATRDELMLLPRIGPVIADYIIEYRESVRPARAFQRAEDLEFVHRIGPITVERLRPVLHFPRVRDRSQAEDAAP